MVSCQKKFSLSAAGVDQNTNERKKKLSNIFLDSFVNMLETILGNRAHIDFEIKLGSASRKND